MVGKRGQQTNTVSTILQGQSCDTDSRSSVKDGGAYREKKVRRPGLIPPRRSARQRIEPGEFGDRREISEM